jgi:hypothetical protein
LRRGVKTVDELLDAVGEPVRFMYRLEHTCTLLQRSPPVAKHSGQYCLH